MAATDPINPKADLPNVAVKQLALVASISSATTLTALDSGRILNITIPPAAGLAYTITLPAPTTPGMKYKMVVTTCAVANDNKDVTIACAAANKFYGWIVGNATRVACAGGNTITLDAASAVPAQLIAVGDFLEFESTGTIWNVKAVAATAAAITVP